MDLTDEMKRALRSVSKSHLDFVQQAVQDPRYFDRAEFKELDVHDWATEAAIQSWPTFIDGPAISEMKRVAVGLCHIVKRIPEVIFGFDIDLMSEFYLLNSDYLRYVILGGDEALKQTLSGAVGRGDFLVTPEGLWCVEFNIASNLGGIWETTTWERKMTAVPVIAEYLERNNLHVKIRNTLRMMMRHIVENAQQHLPGLGMEINMAYVFMKEHINSPEEQVGLSNYLQENYKHALQEMGSGHYGDFILCSFEDLQIKDGIVYFGDKRIHVVVEFTEGMVPLHILRCQQQRTINLHNGPITNVLCNKLNMALLSEFQSAGLFEPWEEAMIQKHVPWTRRVKAANAEWEGNTVWIPDLVKQNRAELVLKKAVGSSGRYVITGHSQEQEEWEKALERALQEDDWVIQKYIPCPPFPYQQGDYGCTVHDVIWGLFVFGDEYAGAFLRTLPKGNGAVVNRQRGSRDGVVLEVQDQLEMTKV